MKTLGLAIRRLSHQSLALAFFVAVALPRLAWAQIDSATTSASHSSASTTTTTTETADFVSDWRFWALLGAVLLVILIIAMSRGRSGPDRVDHTTVVR
jgi:Trk-type K+ transport system membrane component